MKEPFGNVRFQFLNFDQPTLTTSPATDVAKIAPAVPAAVMNFLDYAIVDWVSAVALVYMLMLVAHFIVCKDVRPWHVKVVWNRTHFRSMI